MLVFKTQATNRCELMVLQNFHVSDCFK